MGSGIFRDLGLEDNLPSRVSLCKQSGMDCLFLPVMFKDNPFSDYDYRSFLIEDLEKSLPADDISINIILDGPFQRMARKEGMPSVFSLFFDPPKIIDKLEEEMGTLSSEISQLSAFDFDAILLADDIAYQQGTYTGLSHFRMFLAPIYRRIVNLIHHNRRLALFHSDGNWTLFASALGQCGFDGFAAIQSECMDLLSLQKKTGKILMAGMEFFHLASLKLEPAKQTAWLQWINGLALEGRFILASSCGISSKQDLENLKCFYNWVDNRTEILDFKALS